MSKPAKLTVGPEIIYAMGGTADASFRWLRGLFSAPIDESLLFFLDTSDEYRARKEEFVTGHHGSTMWEVAIGLSCMPASLLLLRTTLSFLCLLGFPAANWSTIVRTCVEVLIVAMPALLSLTLLSDYGWQITGGLLLLSLLQHYIALCMWEKPLLSLSLVDSHSLYILAQEKRKSFITNFRSGMMLTTWIAILAVDFPVFPRRFAKTETFGISVMDMGVGAFILASAVVSRQTRRSKHAQQIQLDTKTGPQRSSISCGCKSCRTIWPSPRRATKVEEHKEDAVVPAALRRRKHTQTSDSIPAAGGAGAVPTHTSSDATAALAPQDAAAFCREVACALWSTITAVSPLIVLGLGRTTIHTALNYQTHVTEYGVHWNFPFTTVVVACLSAGLEVVWRSSVFTVEHIAGCRLLVSQTCSAAMYITLGLTVAVAYQVVLALPAAVLAPLVGAENATSTSVQEYILYASREGGFFAQNREGLAGVVGFFAVYLCGVAIGRVLMDSGFRDAQGWRTFAAKAAVGCLGLWTIAMSSVYVCGAVSRRLVNLPYVLWIVAYGCTMTTSLLLVDVVSVSHRAPPSVASKVDERKMYAPFAGTMLAPLWDKLFVMFVHDIPVASSVLEGGSLLMESINSNFLALFILSNLLVGIPNHTIRTIDVSDLPATCILSVYSVTLCAVAVWWRKLGVHLKFW